MIEGARLRRRGRLDAQQVSSLAVALDGQQVLTGDRHGRVLMFVEERGGGWRPRPLRRDQFVAPIVAAAFVPEIRGAVVVTEGRELVFFELDKKPREGEHNAYSFEQMAEIPRRLVVAGDRAVTRGESEAPEVWALGGAERRRAALARLDGVGGGAALEVASKRSYAWTGSIGGEVRAWNLDSGAGQGAAVFRDHGKSPIRGAALSRDDSRLASVGADGTVLVYELDGDRDAAPTRLDGLVVGATWSLSFSPEGRWLAAISEGEVLVWSMDQKASPPLRGSDDGISRLVWQDEVHLVSGGRGGIRVWEVVDGGLKVQRPLAPWGQVDYVATGAGLVGAVSSMEMSSRVQVWDKNGELMLDEPQMSAARAFVFGQEGELAVGFASGVVKSWRCAASPRCTLANTWDGAGVVALSFSSTGELVVGDEGGSVRRLGKDMLELEEPAHRGKGPVVAVAAGPEEVVWGRGRQLVLSRGKFDAELVSPVELAGGHRGAITQVLVQAGTVAVSVGEDNTVRVWPLSAERLAARAERAGSGP